MRFRTTLFVSTFAVTALALAPAVMPGHTDASPSLTQQVVDLQHPEPPFATVIKVTTFAYVCLKHQGPFSEITSTITSLMSATQSQNIYPQGPLIAVFYNSPMEVKPEELEWEVGFPVTPQAVPEAPLFKKTWDWGKVARAVHVGPYEKLGQTIERLADWIDKNGYAIDGPQLERYLDMNPSQVDPDKLRTEIWVPVKAK